MGTAASVPVPAALSVTLHVPKIPKHKLDFMLDEEDVARERKIEQEWEKVIVDLKALMTGLRLKEDDIKAIHESFAYMDKSSTNAVQISAFLEAIHVGKTPFADRIINYFQVKGGEQLKVMDFRTFFKITWSYCTLDHAELVHFVYDLYDPEDRQELDNDEMSTMLGDLFGRNYLLKDEAVGVLSEFTRITKENGPLNMPDFRKYVKNHQKLLFPAFQFQLYMREHIVGDLFWARLTELRVKTFKSGKLIKEADFLALELQTGVDFYRDGEANTDAVDPNAGEKVYRIRGADKSPLGYLTCTQSSAIERKSMTLMAARTTNSQGNALYMFNIKNPNSTDGNKNNSRPTSRVNTKARIEAAKNA